MAVLTIVSIICRTIMNIVLVSIAVATMIIAVVALLLTLEGRLSLPKHCRCKRCEVMCRIPDRTGARGVLNSPAGCDNWKSSCSLETLHALAWTIGAGGPFFAACEAESANGGIASWRAVLDGTVQYVVRST